MRRCLRPAPRALAVLLCTTHFAAAFQFPTANRALLERAGRWRDALEAAGWPRPPGEGPILSVRLGADAAALAAQERLEAAGLLALAIRPPTVPEGTARLRLVLRVGLPAGTLEKLLEALGPAPRPPAAR